MSNLTDSQNNILVIKGKCKLKELSSYGVFLLFIDIKKSKILKFMSLVNNESKLFINPLKAYNETMNMINNSDSIGANHLFEIPDAILPKRNDPQRDVEYSTMQKVPISFLCEKAGKVTIELLKGERIVWSTDLAAAKGLNQYRWDLLINRSDNQLPYYIHYLSFPSPGEYSIRIGNSDFSASKTITIGAYK